MDIITEITGTKAYESLTSIQKLVAVRKDIRNDISHGVSMCNALGGFDEFEQVSQNYNYWEKRIIEEIYNNQKHK